MQRAKNIGEAQPPLNKGSSAPLSPPPPLHHCKEGWLLFSTTKAAAHLAHFRQLGIILTIYSHVWQTQHEKNNLKNERTVRKKFQY